MASRSSGSCAGSRDMRNCRQARRLLLGGIAICAFSLAAGLWYRWPYFARPPVGPPEFALPDVNDWPKALGARDDRMERDMLEKQFTERFIGHTQDRIVERFGQPEFRFEGRDAVSEGVYRRCPEAVRVVYSQPSGWLELYYCKENNDVWLCFGATWNPEGWSNCWWPAD